MSFGTAFASALSGLTAASKASELVSSNIANATTPGYGRRALSLTAVRRRMIWNIRGDFGAEVIGSSGLGYAALR